MCNLFCVEDAIHITVQCEGTADLCREMYESIGRVGKGDHIHIFEKSANILYTLFDKKSEDITLQTMMEVWEMSCKYVSLLN